MQRIDDRLARHDLKLSSSEALLSRRYRRSMTPGMDPSELSIVTVQLSGTEGKHLPSRTGSPQTTTIRFADSLPVRHPEKLRTRLENPYAPPGHHYYNPHPHVQSMIVRKTRSFAPPPLSPELSSRSITPSPTPSQKPLPPCPQEPSRHGGNRTRELKVVNQPTPPESVSSDDNSSGNRPRETTTPTKSELPTESESTSKVQEKKAAAVKQLSRPKKRDPLIPPLTKVHFSCYQSHRYFASSNNALYPVPCMTCLKSDQQIRWRCTFCCLRICGECMQTIRKCERRSLKELMECLLRELEAA
ncbi:hypothetical protein FQN55_003010 [Onygenales sp. PD_40]|nr:hypothetical protein FQN55_003010 [Onygenales sp. PD_40]KAK2784675.1 hypothetical protein FQN52_008903 [Onygenales sp. PD_12]KAK2784717.1 hypothetical protein FQN53_008273 [Emmonsiellopsis sp. PD_33]